MRTLFSVNKNVSSRLNKFSEQVKNSSLENIISTIEVLQKREFAVHKLREIMVKHYKEVL